MSDLSLASPDGQRVSWAELFFDVVFVFSVTQVVGILHSGVTLGRVAEAVLVFWLVWWAWTQFTWALNAANTDHPRIELAILLSTGVAFFMAVSVPGAFGAGALWFGLTYVSVRAIGLLVYWWVAADAAHKTAVRVFALASVAGLVAVLTGAAVGGSAQYWLWGAAILLDVIAAARAGGEEGWNLHPEHFVERHGLIVIIALGESLIVAASGLSEAPTDPGLIIVAILSVALACGLWWSYFPYVRPVLEQALLTRSGAGLSMAARDVFSLIHFPMLCGIIGTAAGLEEILLHPEEPLPLGGRLALAGGVSLFLGGSALAKLRALGMVPWVRVMLTVATGGVILALDAVPPWLALAVGVTGILAIVASEERYLRRHASTHEYIRR